MWEQPALTRLRESLRPAPDEPTHENEAVESPSPDISEIEAKLASEDPNARAEALAAAGYFQHLSLYDRVAKTALNGSGVERNAALYALGFYRRDIPEDALKALLDDEDPNIRMSALEIATRKDPAPHADRAMEVLRAALVRATGDEASWQERHQLNSLIRMLARFCRGRLPQPLLAGLEDPAPGMRKAVAQALGMGGNPEAVPALRPLTADEDEDVAKAARLALWALGPEPCEPAGTAPGDPSEE
jgi:HEAT repeat protein